MKHPYQVIPMGINRLLCHFRLFFPSSYSFKILLLCARELGKNGYLVNFQGPRCTDIDAILTRGDCWKQQYPKSIRGEFSLGLTSCKMAVVISSYFMAPVTWSSRPSRTGLCEMFSFPPRTTSPIESMRRFMLKSWTLSVEELPLWTRAQTSPRK